MIFEIGDMEKQERLKSNNKLRVCVVKNMCGWVKLTDRLTDNHSHKVRCIKRIRANMTLTIYFVSSFTLNSLCLRAFDRFSTLFC